MIASRFPALTALLIVFSGRDHIALAFGGVCVLAGFFSFLIAAPVALGACSFQFQPASLRMISALSSGIITTITLFRRVGFV
ncbi:hypothetical protein GGS23DRAFT_239338 [Durotheca rogersii]|uniref:uncharacterized protein n=1 Tax=Durotheca rogersii TaxID=419775 RepID=UPI00221E7494|nr:uncharacterized protein GGS23DRAFT_239338 [Durotheca rogersii]KAI5860203.1 hypothetical protein GGS23DRAFT_239338 [Durotheca rogersii]